jgi:UDP-N-acetylmuramate dehydrogenase
MIEKTVDLQAFNTFNLRSVAERYFRLDRLSQLKELGLTEAPGLVLGSGSNLLLLDEVPGLTLHVNLKGICEVDASGQEKPVANHYPQNDQQHIIRVAAGVNWHQFVLYTLERGLHGLENLALIPGTIGASPIQNIGAYGAEVAQYIKTVHAYEYGKGMQQLSAADCAFGYRDSRFKREPGRFLVTAVDFQLGGAFKSNTSYGAIADRVELRFPAQEITAVKIARAVIEIRTSKLPFYSQLGNSGSFFKNPEIPHTTHAALLKEYPELPAYPLANGKVKIPAGWLIDRAGWKGKRKGAVGTFKRQALVIVNHGGATGKEILAFSKEIQNDVEKRYGIRLEREVRLIGIPKSSTHE